MKSFRDQVLRRALDELAQREQRSRPWMAPAREALEAFFQAPPSEESGLRLAEELGAIVSWPERSLMEEMGETAEPIESLLSDAFCRIEKNAEGQERAILWKGMGRLMVDGGELRVEREQGSRLPALPPHFLFMTSDWNGPPQLRGSMEIEERVALIAEERKARGSLVYLDDFSEGVALPLLGVKRKASEDHWSVMRMLADKEDGASEIVSLGLARATQLSWTAHRLSSEILMNAGMSATKRLAELLDRLAPSLTGLNEMAQRWWGKPLSLEAVATAGAWGPLASQLLKEDPRRAQIALIVAPRLGLSASSDLLSKAKGELKSMGLPEAVWKELALLNESDFANVLGRFKRAAKTGVGDASALAADPFLEPSRDSAGAEAISAVARGLELTSKAARLAGAPLSSALGFCSGRMDIAPVWEERFAEEMGLAGSGARAAGERLMDACVKASLQGPAWADEETVAAEKSAALGKGPKLIALAMMEAQKRPLGEALAELNDLTDWITRSEFGIWQQLPEKMSWASLRRRQQAWHEELSLSSNPEFGSPWTVLLDKPLEIEGRVARELASGSELFEEGKAMRHCVSTYAQDCREGSSRIYSITKAEDGSREATLEVRFLAAEMEGAPSRAERAQLRGVCNQQVTDPGALKASEAVVAALNEKLAARAKATARPEEAGAVEPAKLMRALLERRRAGAADAARAAPGPRPD